MSRTRDVIMGAAGRDFHNLNVASRGNDAYEVVTFTATQIPGIEGRRDPAVLAGVLYPEGIPIYEEKDLTRLIKEQSIDLAVFAYSDVRHSDVMHKASEVNAAGAEFLLMGSGRTLIKSTKPVVSVCAV